MRLDVYYNTEMNCWVVYSANGGIRYGYGESPQDAVADWKVRLEEARSQPREVVKATQRCPECWTYGHYHRKGCAYEGQGMAHHIRMTDSKPSHA